MEYKLKWQLLHLPSAFISVILCLYINTGLYICRIVCTVAGRARGSRSIETSRFSVLVVKW